MGRVQISIPVLAL